MSIDPLPMWKAQCNENLITWPQLELLCFALVKVPPGPPGQWDRGNRVLWGKAGNSCRTGMEQDQNLGQFFRYHRPRNCCIGFRTMASNWGGEKYPSTVPDCQVFIRSRAALPKYDLLQFPWALICKARNAGSCRSTTLEGRLCVTLKPCFFSQCRGICPFSQGLHIVLKR